MNKPKDFDTAKAFGDYDPLPAGGYICKIIGAKEAKSKAGNDKIELAVDIAEGDEKGRFEQAYKSNTSDDKKWPVSAVIHQVITNNDGNTNGNFKAFADAVVESNSGFEIQWGDNFANCFKNKLIGIIFQKQQYENRNGKVVWKTQALQEYKTLDDIRNGKFKVPEDKYLEDSKSDNPMSGLTPIDDSEIPF